MKGGVDEGRAEMGVSISIRGLDFAFAGNRPIFRGLSLELGKDNPAVILGPSGCGKTTLLRLIAGLLKPQAGELEIISGNSPGVSFVFQEPRLLPWKTVLENVSLPLIETLGTEEAANRARRFLALVSLEDKARSLPAELSGGQRQRANLARAFACPAPVLLMDEPFQSLDIPLRLRLMDLTLALLAEFPRLAVAVSHDPREAAYLGRRVIILGESPRGIIHDEVIRLDDTERRYGSAAQGALEQKLLSFFGEDSAPQPAPPNADNRKRNPPN
jgi:NitT/TauT family transport system ATP-binding protein